MVSTWAELFREEMVLTPAETSDEHYQPENFTSIAFFPDGKRIFSGSSDKIARRWDLQSGKEIKEARDVCKEEIWVVAVSRDGRWVVTGGGVHKRPELKACEVETGIIKSFEGQGSRGITSADISADSTLLAGGSSDSTARIWNLQTGKLMAGPFKTVDRVGAVRFSPDSKKLAVKSSVGKCLEVWDIQSQKLDVKIGQSSEEGSTDAPVLWTNTNKNILTAFSFNLDGQASTIYEFDASTLKTVGTPLEHNFPVNSLALLFDGALVVSAYNDATIKVWAFESRQLLASYSVSGTVVHTLMPSPDSLQLAFTTYGDPDIYIFKVTPALLSIQSTLRKTDTNLLNSDATRRPAVVRRTPAKRPVISFPPRPQIRSPAIDHQQPIFLRHVRKLFHFSSGMNSVPPAQPRDPWDFPATSPLPPNRSATPQVATQFDQFEISSPPPPRRSNRITQFLRQGLPFRRSGPQPEPPVVEVAPGRKFTRLAAAKFPEYRKVDDTRHPSGQQTTAPQNDPTSDSADIDSLPDVHWVKALLCYYSCWSHGRLRKPPRWRLERVDIPHQRGTTSSSCNASHSNS